MKKLENSESVARVGWTETTTSLARYAMRATGRGQSMEQLLVSIAILLTSLSSSQDGSHGRNDSLYNELDKSSIRGESSEEKERRTMRRTRQVVGAM